MSTSPPGDEWMKGVVVQATSLDFYSGLISSEELEVMVAYEEEDIRGDEIPYAGDDVFFRGIDSNSRVTEVVPADEVTPIYFCPFCDSELRGAVEYVKHYDAWHPRESPRVNLP